MRILVAAVGRLKQGPERELAERYLKRAAQAGRTVGIRSVETVEIRESRARDAARRMIEESIAIASIVPADSVSLILDARGENVSSASLAGRLQGWRGENVPGLAFIIGSHDGLAPSLRGRARLAIAFGTATWPHQLVRVMLLEQIYRAITLLAGHPYHRG